MKSKISLVILFFGIILCEGCGVYSFTGSTLSSDVKTMSIQTFYNNALLGPSNMSITFTESIKDYFQQNTGLILVDQDGDIQLEGYIESFTLTPVAAAASGNGPDLANQSRITINVSATYVNTIDPTFDFDKRFSNFRDFDQASTDLSQVEEQLVEEIFEQIIIDIFNSSVANW